MRKDPTKFRERFLAYKDGKSVKEIYNLPEYQSGKVNWSRWDNAQTSSYTVPFIKDKTVTLTNAGRATGARLSTNLLDSLADNAMRAGVPVRTAIGLATKESTLGNPTDDRTAWNISSAIREQFNGVYPGTVQHINSGNDIIQGDNLINYHKGNIDTRVFHDHTGKSVIQEGLEFYKQHPDKYNPGLPGYQKAVQTRGDEVMKSPEVLKWYNEWENKQVRVKRPEPYIKTSIQNTAAPKFGKYADGKLPKYGDGNIPVTTGGTGMPAPQFYGGISEEARPTADALERISNFAPYVGTILDILEVINGNLAKTPSAVIGAVADVALPGIRTAWKGIKAAKTAMLNAPMLIDKIKNYKLLQKLQKKFVANIAYQGVGTYQDVLDDQGYIKSTKQVPKHADGKLPRFANGTGEIQNNISEEYTPLMSNVYQPMINSAKQQVAKFAVDDYAYRVQKQHPEVTKELLLGIYNSTPYIGSDSRKGSTVGQYWHGEDDGYGRRVMVYPRGMKSDDPEFNLQDRIQSTVLHESNHLLRDAVLGGKYTDKEREYLETAYPGVPINEAAALNAQIREKLSNVYGKGAVGEKLDATLEKVRKNKGMQNEMMFHLNNLNGYGHADKVNGQWDPKTIDAMINSLMNVASVQTKPSRGLLRAKDGKLPGYGDGKEPEPVQAAKSAINFANLYYKSPGFNERFRNVTSNKIGFLNSLYNPTAYYWEDDGWENHPKMSWNVKRTPLKIGKIQPIPEPNAKYDPYSGNVLWGDSSTPLVTGMDWNTIMAHELGHALDLAIKVNNKLLGPKLHEDAGERGYTYSNLFPILRKSKPYQQIRNTMDAKEARDYDKYPATYTGGLNLNSHDARPEENYADLFSMRKVLYDLGIFDSTKSGLKFTKLHLDTFKKKSKNRLLDNFSDEDVIWMINNIASTGNNKKLSHRQKEV